MPDSENPKTHGADLSEPAALLARVIAGDRGALRTVYDHYVGLLHFIVRRLGLTREDADEIVQEVFLRFFQRVGEVRDAARLKSWLVSCARNMAVDRLRQRRRQTQAVSAESAADAGWTPLWQDQSAPGAEAEAEIMLVRELLTRLATEEPGGESLRQFYVDGLSAREIAERNGEAVSTVTTRLSRLRRRFGELVRSRIEELRATRLTD